MIHITGDTHGKRDWGKIFMAYKHRHIAKGDYVIICGDFGGVWYGNGKDDELLNRYSKSPFTILFIDGNHENFDKLYEYPVEDWNGGKVHKIRDNVLHLMRGQIFTIEDKTFFTLGGGTSIDKEWRLQYERENSSYKKPCKIWWEQEIPTLGELGMATVNLLKYRDNVDYIITHTMGNKFMKQTLDFVKEESILNEYLDIVMQTVEYKRWFCGHFHVDRDYKEQKVSMLYDRIITLE